MKKEPPPVNNIDNPILMALNCLITVCFQLYCLVEAKSIYNILKIHLIIDMEV